MFFHAENLNFQHQVRPMRSGHTCKTQCCKVHRVLTCTIFTTCQNKHQFSPQNQPGKVFSTAMGGGFIVALAATALSVATVPTHNLCRICMLQQCWWQLHQLTLTLNTLSEFQEHEWRQQQWQQWWLEQLSCSGCPWHHLFPSPKQSCCCKHCLFSSPQTVSLLQKHIATITNSTAAAINNSPNLLCA